MKVLFISSGNSRFGISPIIRNQGESLKQAGLNLEYFVINGKGFISYFKHIFILKKHIRNKTYNVFHAHYALSAVTATLAGCKPLIVSLMGSDIRSGILLNSIIRFFTYFRWDVTIVKSALMQKEIRIKSACIIPNGVNLNEVNAGERQIAGSSTKTILFAANPEKHVKNFALAEKAVSLINDDSVQLKVVHSKSHSEIVREINNADILLHTSYWEGSPNLIKEALACNCPVVSTDVGDVKWLFGVEPGHFITSFDPQDVADKIKLALHFAETTGKTKGRDRIINLGLDSATVAKKILAIYENISRQK